MSVPEELDGIAGVGALQGWEHRRGGGTAGVVVWVGTLGWICLGVLLQSVGGVGVLWVKGMYWGGAEWCCRVWLLVSVELSS